MLYNGIVLRAMGLIKGLEAKGPITTLRGPWVLHSSHPSWEYLFYYPQCTEYFPRYLSVHGGIYYIHC